MGKILIIGQAPPAVKQNLPYDTTMLYDWFSQVGVSKEDAQKIFSFDAVYDKFPGFSKNGGHLTPTFEQMEDYWNRSLKHKVDCCSKIITLGNVARSYLSMKKPNKKMIHLIHPSYRNKYRFDMNKDFYLNQLKNFLTQQHL